MFKTLLTSRADWRNLVKDWIVGIKNPDDNLRTTTSYKQLEEALRVPKKAVAAFNERKLSRRTAGYLDFLAENAGIRPANFPAVMIWQFITVPQEDDFIFMDATFQLVMPEHFS